LMRSKPRQGTRRSCESISIAGASRKGRLCQVVFFRFQSRRCCSRKAPNTGDHL
jgi:hypothetical protein